MNKVGEYFKILKKALIFNAIRAKKLAKMQYSLKTRENYNISLKKRLTKAKKS